MKNTENKEIKQQQEALTEREMDVLKKIIEGKDNYQIGKELFLSYHTIKIHVAVILKKLNVKNRTQAAIKAVLEGIVE